jgi:hypothetical protein
MKYIIIIVLFFLSSCYRNVYPKFDYKASENPWVTAFKDRVFFSAIKEAYKSDTIIFKQIEKKDALNPYDGLSLAEMEEADKLGKRLIKNIPPPAMCEGCLGDKNYYMATALHYYISKDLDLIATNIFKIHLKKDKLLRKRLFH